MKSLITLLFLFSLTNQLAAQKVGLVLSGGGARALCHIGVIKALEENEIPIDYITGTSMGALVGSMYARGLSAAQMEVLVTDREFASKPPAYMNDEYTWYFLEKAPDAGWVTIKFAYDSVLRMRLPESVSQTAHIDWSLMEAMAAPIARAGYKFDSLMIPFRCVAADIKSKQQVIFSEGDLAQAVRASMSFPFYFPPLTTQNKIMFDGGIYNNFPVDVMEKNFNPDIIIGVNAGQQSEIVFDDNILSQVKTMLVQQQNVIMPHDSDMLIVPDVSQYSVFDFEVARAAIDSGYRQTMRCMAQIKERISRRLPDEDLQKKRAAFFDKQVVVKVDQVIFENITTSQAKYFRRIIKPVNKPEYLFMLKKNYFRMCDDANVRAVNPKLILNPETGYYDMHLEVKREKDLQFDFGGNFSSRPINMGYVGVRKNWLGSESYSLEANTYFGKLYNSAHVDLRVDVPGKFNFFVEPEFNINKFDYFKSSSAFFEDVNPSYLVQTDGRFGVNFGIPARNKGKLVASASVFNILNKYYQTRDFTQADTSDRTKFSGYTTGLSYERNSYNFRMYPNRGSLFGIYARFVEGNENTQLGTTSASRDTIEQFHHWFQMKVVWDDYFAKAGPMRFGFYTELNFSTEDFFSNYTASILMAPAFMPTPESQTIFLDKFHAFNYGAFGLKAVWEIVRNLDLRAEGYVFQPFNEILLAEDGLSATFGEPLAKRYFIADANLVYHSPLGPISLSFNYYYDTFDQPYSVMFHFGYIIFNKRTLD